MAAGYPAGHDRRVNRVLVRMPIIGASLQQARAHFTMQQIADWEKESQVLNARREGDAGGYILTKA